MARQRKIGFGSPGARFRLKGADRVINRLEGLALRFPKQAASALLIEGEHIMTRSKRDYVPVNLGILRGTGTVDPPVIVGRHISVRLSFGGPSAPYALAVHEHPSVHSPPTWQGKEIEDIRSVRTGTPWVSEGKGAGPKYLERPFREALNGMNQRLSGRISRELSRSGKDTTAMAAEVFG